MPPLWRIEELFQLSDEYPSGLCWSCNKAGYKKGEQAGRLDKKTGFYVLWIDAERFLAHRIVYYLRTGVSPDNHSVEHLYSNRDKDNRLELRATYLPRKQKTEKQSRIVAV